MAKDEHNRLQRKDIIILTDWMRDNRKELEALTLQEIAERASIVLIRTVSTSTIAGMREDLGWPARRAASDANQLQIQFEDHETRLQAIEVKLGLRLPPSDPLNPSGA